MTVRGIKPPQLCDECVFMQGPIYNGMDKPVSFECRVNSKDITGEVMNAYSGSWKSVKPGWCPIEESEEGHWIYMDTSTVHGKCSCCGFEAHYYEDDVYGYDYCPNCGARLRSGDE